MPTLNPKLRKTSLYREMLKDLRGLKRKIEQGEPILVHQVAQMDGRMIIRKKRMPASEFFGRNQQGDHMSPMSGAEVKQLRDDLALSQAAFARWLAASPGTVRQWEQKTGVKAGPALRLLQVLRSDTKAWRKRIHGELVAV
jgi:putative transcriptional regulator